MSLFRHCFRLAAALALSLAALAGPAAAQDNLYAPAVVVNDALITEFDIDQRTKLIRLMGGPQGDLREMAIGMLIEDRLRDQAAEAAGITLTEAQIEAAMREFAQQRNLGLDQLMGRLRQAGVTRQAMVDLISNQAAFREAMRLRFLARATPSETEIETEQERGLGTARLSVRLAELVIPIQERGDIRTAQLAQELYDELNGGGDFAAAVRSYSRAPSARRGGEVGWLPLDRLPPSIGTEIAVLAPGQVTRPIDVPNAVVILKLLETREDDGTEADPDAARVTVGRLIIPLRSNASETDIAAAQVEAEQIGRQIASCADVEARKASYDPASGIEGPVPLGALTDAERDAIAPLAAGQVGPPVRLREGMAVIVLCARSGGTDPTSIEQVRSRLIAERMQSFAQGYLQELRRDALIEYR